jgi:hypothetical protein
LALILTTRSRQLVLHRDGRHLAASEWKDTALDANANAVAVALTQGRYTIGDYDT